MSRGEKRDFKHLLGLANLDIPCFTEQHTAARHKRVCCEHAFFPFPSPPTSGTADTAIRHNTSIPGCHRLPYHHENPFGKTTDLVKCKEFFGKAWTLHGDMDSPPWASLFQGFQVAPDRLLSIKRIVSYGLTTCFRCSWLVSLLRLDQIKLSDRVGKLQNLHSFWHWEKPIFEHEVIPATMLPSSVHGKGLFSLRKKAAWPTGGGPRRGRWRATAATVLWAAFDWAWAKRELSIATRWTIVLFKGSTGDHCAPNGLQL